MNKSIVILPIGSQEYHGKHLPLNTDTLVAEYFAKNLAQKFSRNGFTVDILPTMNYGCSSEHDDLPGTISVPYMLLLRVFEKLLKGIIKNYRFSSIIALNAHGGNQDIVELCARQINYNNIDTKIFVSTLYNQDFKQWCIENNIKYDAHAGNLECNIISAITGNKISYTNKNTEFDSNYYKKWRTSDFSKNGLISNHQTINSDPETGRKIVDKITDTIFLEWQKYVKISCLERK